MSDSSYPDSKRCSKCGVMKPLSRFDKNGNGGKLRSTCKNCRAKAKYERHKERLKSDPEYAAKQRASQTKRHRKWVKGNREHVRAYDAMYRLDPFNQLRNRVGAKVAYAVRAGVLVKPDRCSKCGVVGYVEGHHENYFAPLDVQWLCKPCHDARHKGDSNLNSMRAKHGFPPFGDWFLT